MEEAKNQLLLQATPTPLQATDRDTTRKLFVGTGYEGVTPATGAIRYAEWALSRIETPATPFTPATPGLLHAATKKLTSIDREEIRSQFAALPAPQNEYEASLPEEEEEAKEETKQEDAEEIERQIREEEAAMEREELARRSAVLKRGLPRGNVIAPRFFVECDEAEKALKEEMNAIIRYEDYKYPSAESTRKYTEEVTLPVLGYEEKVKAEMMVLEEEGDLKSETPEEEVESAFWTLWTREEADLMYNPTTKEVVHANELSEVEVERGCDEIGGKSGVLSPFLLVSAEADHEADEACPEE